MARDVGFEPTRSFDHRLIMFILCRIVQVNFCGASFCLSVWAGIIARCLMLFLNTFLCHGNSYEVTVYPCFTGDCPLVLTGHVEFKAVLQRGNRIQVPRLIRWSYQMESTQVLKVSVHFEGDWSSEKFFAQMSKDGRICVPKLACGLLKAAYEEESMIGAVVVVQLRPFDADEETEDEEEED